MTTEEHAAAKVRWWRRRPPADLPAFSRRVWWAGHALLFAGLGLLALGPALFVFAWLFMLEPSVAGLGVLFIAIGPALATAGLILRPYATSRSSVSGSWPRRVITLTITVLCSAVVLVVVTLLIGMLIFYLSGGMVIFFLVQP